jgi:cell division protein FtsB
MDTGLTDTGLTDTAPTEAAALMPLPPQNEVFISYSRRDTAFVRSLDAAFRRAGRDPWVDWEDIPDADLWRQAIAAGIEAADAFVFVISPDSVASVECGKELTVALGCQKRIIPLLHREAVGVAPALSELNWIFFRAQDDFDVAFGKLIAAIETDLAHVRLHTRLLVRALEWEQGRDDGFLLRGKDLVTAQQWLVDGAAKEPKPTALHQNYVTQSVAVAGAEMRLVDAGRRATAIVRRSLLMAVGVALVAVAGTAAVVYRAQEQVAALNGEIATRQTEIATLNGKITNLDALQQQLQTERSVLIEQLKRFGFTDTGIEQLLAAPREEFNWRVRQVEQANVGYRTLETMLKSGMPAPGAPGMPVPQPNAPAGSESTPAPMLPTRTSAVVVEYYPKEINAAAFEKILSKFGYRVQVRSPEITDIPINVIFYGKDVPEQDLKLVALTLVRAGVRLRAIQPFRRLADSKGMVIQVGALRELQGQPALEAKTILEQSAPLPR